MRQPRSHLNETAIVRLESDQPDNLSVFRLRLPPSPPCRSPRSRERIDKSAMHQAAPPKARPSKRLMDVTLALALIVLFAPLMMLIALAIKRDGGPVLYAHRRIGSDKRPFCCWKFRSMVINADDVLRRLIAQDQRTHEEWERSFKLRSDPRVTAIGKLLRAYSFDELPQLLNVVMGTMSLVGPRPIVEAEIQRYGSAISEPM
jgi:exopolysaccharide production protein ExoY